MPAVAEPRPSCYRCLRPAAMCVCGDLPRVDNRTEVVIVQHPRERGHPFGTARLAKLGLARARVEVAFGSSDGAVALDCTPPPGAALLYPGPRARDVADLRDAARPRTLYVLDGTWPQSRRLYEHNRWLHALPHVRLSPAEPSRYRIRREPRRECLSTIEAIVTALRVLEPDTRGLDQLLLAFERMIDRQIRHAGVRAEPRFKVARDRPPRHVPALLAHPGLVVVYGETSLPGGHAGRARELVQWAALRLADSAVFEAFVRPTLAPPGAVHLAHMGLDPAAIEDGVTAGEVRARFSAFAGDEPVLAAWSPSTLRIARTMLGLHGREVVMKSAYCNARGGRCGTLDDVIAREELAPAANACRGRARRRLGHAAAIARWLATTAARWQP